MIREGTVSKIVPIECTVCTQQLPYSLSKSCICGTLCNFDSIVAKISICLDNGPRTSYFKYGPYWIDSVCVISNTSFDEITKFYPTVTNPIVTKFSKSAAHNLGRSGFENGAN